MEQQGKNTTGKEQFNCCSFLGEKIMAELGKKTKGECSVCVTVQRVSNVGNQTKERTQAVKNDVQVSDLGN